MNPTTEERPTEQFEVEEPILEVAKPKKKTQKKNSPQF